MLDTIIYFVCKALVKCENENVNAIIVKKKSFTKALLLYIFLQFMTTYTSLFHSFIIAQEKKNRLPVSRGPSYSFANSPFLKILRVGYPLTPYFEQVSVSTVQSTLRSIQYCLFQIQMKKSENMVIFYVQ